MIDPIHLFNGLSFEAQFMLLGKEYVKPDPTI